jgi:hypothetical protein
MKREHAAESRIVSDAATLEGGGIDFGRAVV